MKQALNFAKNCLNGIVLAVWTVVVCTVFVLWFGADPSLKVCAVTGAIGVFGIILLARLLTFRINTVQGRDRLSWYVFLALLVMAATINITADNLKGVFVGCVSGWIFCSILCGIMIDRCSELKIELENIRKRDTAEYIRRMVRAKKFLHEEYEEVMLQLPDADVIAARYIKYSRFFRSVEKKFLQDRRFTKLWREYFKHYSLLDSQEMELFERDDAWEIIEAYSAGSQLCERGELKLFSMPNAKKWVKMYIENGAFGSVRAERKLFETPEYTELAEYYKSRYALYDDTCQMLQTAYQY